MIDPLSNSFNTGTGITTLSDLWGWPERVQIIELPNSIEMIYKQTSLVTITTWPSRPPEVRLFKIIYSCKDGKWNKSEPIYGKINPAQEEWYEFED